MLVHLSCWKALLLNAKYGTEIQPCTEIMGKSSSHEC